MEMPMRAIPTFCRPAASTRSVVGATLALALGLLAGCANKNTSEPATQLSEYEGVPMTVRLERTSDTAITVQVRETSSRTGTELLDDLRLYGRAAASLMGSACGPVLSPQLVSETSKQGVVGRDYVFKCAPGRIDRSRPQELIHQQ